MAALAIAAAATIAYTTHQRSEDVRILGQSTAAVATAAGDAAAVFAKADASAIGLASTNPEIAAAAEVPYLQSLATAADNLEAAAQLTRLGEVTEAPIRRVMRSIGSYAADVARARDAAAVGKPDLAAAQRAAATMANIIKPNIERLGAAHDDAVHHDTQALEDATRWHSLITLVPAGALVLLLVVLQVVMALRFRRIVNLPLALAMVLALGVTIRTGDLLERQAHVLADAVNGPHAAEDLLTSARVAAFELEATRTAGQPFDDTEVAEAVSDAAAAAPAGVHPDGTPVDPPYPERLITAFEGYRQAVTENATLDPELPGSPRLRFAVLDAELLNARIDAGTQFDSMLAFARHGSPTHTWLAPLALAAAAALAAFGLQRRLSEYR